MALLPIQQSRLEQVLYQTPIADGFFASFDNINMRFALGLCRGLNSLAAPYISRRYNFNKHLKYFVQDARLLRALLDDFSAIISGEAARTFILGIKPEGTLCINFKYGRECDLRNSKLLLEHLSREGYYIPSSEGSGIIRQLMNSDQTYEIHQCFKDSMIFIIVTVPINDCSFEKVKQDCWSGSDILFSCFVANHFAVCIYPLLLKGYLPKYLRDKITDEELNLLFQNLRGYQQDTAYIIPLPRTEHKETDKDYIDSLASAYDGRIANRE